MKRKITVLCEKNQALATTETDACSFKCGACSEGLVYIPNEKRIGSHGKSEKTIGHKLRKVVEES